MHNHSINCNYVPPAIIRPFAAITTPTVITVTCLGCCKPVDYVGEAGVAFCDHCLSVLSGDEEVVVAKRPVCREDDDDVVISWYSALQHGSDLAAQDATDHEDIAADDLIMSSDEHSRPHVVDEITSCATCADSTEYKCRCGRRACVGCVDEETGLCPQCEA